MADHIIADCETRSLERMRKFQLPNSFKKIGLSITILGFLFLIINKMIMDQEIYRVIGRYSMLIGLLFISLSREKIEDEFIASLRMQSYSLAFIAGVLLALVHPALNYGIDYVIDANEAVFKDSGDFVILWILLSVQVLYFELLKRNYK